MTLSLADLYALVARLPVRLDPVRADPDPPRRRRGSARDRLGQHRRDQRAAHRPQGSRRRDARPRRAEGDVGRRLAARCCSTTPTALAGAAGAFFGHLYPVWLRFRGGKGVATFLGGLLGACWPAAIVFALVWLAVAAATRYSSAAALAASLAAPLAALALGDRRGRDRLRARWRRCCGSATAPISRGCWREPKPRSARKG